MSLNIVNSFKLTPPPPGIVGGWKEAGRTTLGGLADRISVTGLPDKRYYMLLCNVLDDGGSLGARVTVNGDNGSNYARRRSVDGAADTTNAPTTLYTTNETALGDFLEVGYLANLSNKEKLLQLWDCSQQAVGSGTTPRRTEQVGKWTNTVDAVNRIDFAEANGIAEFKAASEVVILEWDPADTHTDNFWDELASADLSGGASDTLDSGSFTAKKYLWIQIYTIGTNTEQQFRFNSDSGNNYASRRSFDGGADTLTPSSDKTKINATGSAGAGCFCNCFVVNNSANEKLAIAQQVAAITAGSGAVPARSEAVFKWANTVDQITSVQGINNGVGDFGTASFIKVWGSD